jgi:hypothetical protein
MEIGHEISKTLMDYFFNESYELLLRPDLIEIIPII